MKKIAIKITFLLLLLSFTQVKITGSYLSDREIIGKNSFATADCFENCDGGIGLMMVSAEPEILLYKNDEGNSVGFVLNNISDYDLFTYKISYSHTTEMGVVKEMVPGTIDNSLHQSTILEEWILLGYCSSGGICVYHDIDGTVDLSVDLVKGGAMQKTLSSSVSF